MVSNQVFYCNFVHDNNFHNVESSKRVNVEERSDPFKRPRRPGGEGNTLLV